MPVMKRPLILFLSCIVALSSCENHRVGKNMPPNNQLTGEASVAEPIDRTIESHEREGLEMPASLDDRFESVLEKQSFTVSYNSQYKCPNYVAWNLYAQRVKGDAERVRFEEDTLVEKRNRVQWYDYSDSGYDRGHMCPAADNKWSQSATNETFLMTNICPQSHNLNAGLWNDLELLCRHWAEQGKDLYIVCGPIFDSENPKTIGKYHDRRIAVPDRFFKVVLSATGDAATIGFIYPNDDCNLPMSEYCVSVDSIESVTGIDFYHILEDELEDLVEAECNPALWGIK